MWIEGARGMRGLGGAAARARSVFVLAAVVALSGVAGCGGGDDQPPAQTAAPGAAAPAPAAPAGPVPGAAEPQTVADLFPAGEGRQLVLNNCASCHAVACAAMGQRTTARWEQLREAHREHASGMSDQELQTVFAYLQTHFNDQQPEPFIPAHFLDRPCTPF